MKSFIPIFSMLLAGLLGAADFEPPQMVMSENKPAGQKLNKAMRSYPSPGMHDLDGDGLKDLFIGDLWGEFTYLKRTKKGWGPEQKLLAADGKLLQFRNW